MKSDFEPKEQPDNSGEFATDQPIKSKSSDRFNRASFAARISETIATRVDSSSIVIGVYGPWGDGKTSLLEMMEEDLQRFSNTIAVRFNPWHFQSEDLLLRGFFATLADAMGRSLPSLKEKAGDLLKKYGAVLSLASFSVAGAFEVKPGEAAKGIGEAMSTVGLDELRKRIEAMLDEAKKRFVVFIDDIDRLDRDETHAIFKLVKLSASFKHTSYVLAFDDEIVSAALGERYGAGGAAAGRAFLEKIIQVPLYLPPADASSMRQLALEGVDSAVKQAKMELNEQQIYLFLRRFEDALLPHLTTPRGVKLLTNALTFALPILRGEVNPVDLILVEGIRVVYPQLYKAIRSNAALFLEGERTEHQYKQQQTVSRIDDLIHSATLRLSARERETVKSKLLIPLFPRLDAATFPADWEKIWEKAQRICSAHHFKRYFSYGIPVGDVSDSQVTAFYESLPRASEAESRTLLEVIDGRQALPRLISRLRQVEESFTADQVCSLITTLCRNADLFPRQSGPGFGGTRTGCAILISNLLQQIVDANLRQAEAEKAISAATPITFAMECIRWIGDSKDTVEEKPVLSAKGADRLKKIIAARIEEEDAISPIFITHPRDATYLYMLWELGTSAANVKGQLLVQLDASPDHIDTFLRCYLGEAWSMETGIPVPADFERRSYDSATQRIPAEYIARSLRQRYGAELGTPQVHPVQSKDQPLRVARQFMSLYNSAETDGGTLTK